MNSDQKGISSFNPQNYDELTLVCYLLETKYGNFQ